jgi:hypothetical protein
LPAETSHTLKQALHWCHAFYGNITCLSFVKAFSTEITSERWKGIFPNADVKWLEAATTTAAVE